MRNRTSHWSALVPFLVIVAVLACTNPAERTGPLVNSAPIANPDNASTAQGVPVTVTVTANDTDPEGQGVLLTGARLSTPATGVTVTTDLDDGTVTVDPGPTFVGTIMVEYDIKDGGTLPRIATGSLTVEVVAGTPPVAVDDQATTQRAVPVTVDVLANDSDPDGGSLTVADPVFLGTQPSGSSVQVNPDQTLTIDPGPGFTGTFDVGYLVRDPTGLEGAGKVTVTVTAPSPATSVRIDIVDDSGDPLGGAAGAFRLGDGAWAPATETSPGRFDVDVPEGESRWGFTARVGDLAQTVEATTTEASAARLTFRDPTVPRVDFALTWNGADNLASGVTGLLFYGLNGLVASGGGASGALTVPQYRADRQDFLAVVTDNGIPVGASIVRDVTPSQGGQVEFSFTADDQGSAATVSPFTVPMGFSGSYLISFTTGGGTAPVGSGGTAGGVLYTFPNGDHFEEGDAYVARAAATRAGADLRVTRVERIPVTSFTLPDPLTGVSAPAPAAYPTFTDLVSTDPEHRMFDLTVGRSAPGPEIQWNFRVGREWFELASLSSYAVSDPTNLPGFEDFGFASGDVAYWYTGYVYGSVESVERGLATVLLGAPTSGGVPLVNGLTLKSASVNGSYIVP